MSHGWVLLTAGLAIIAGCAPEVVIARDQPGSSTGGSAGSGLGGASVTSGTGGDQPLGTAGDGGDGTGNEGGIAGGGSGSGGSGISEPPSLILADSVADFDLVQGARGWSYGFDTGTLDDFTLLPRTDFIKDYMPPSGDEWACWTTAKAHWTQIFQLGAHSNGVNTSPPSDEVLERAVRRWVSTSYAGEIRIVGEVAKIDVVAGGSNGVDAIILIDGVEVHSVPIAGEDAGGVSYETGGTVEIGSKVDFVLDPRDSDDHHDLTRFTAVIERVVAQSD